MDSMAEKRMSRIQYRGVIVGGAVLVALILSTPAAGQTVGNIGSNREPGGLLNDLATGVQYDRSNLAKAEHRLRFLEAKLRRDTGRGRSAAVDRDVRRIENDRYRIAVDEWLIRQNSLVDPGLYPIQTDDVSLAAMTQAARPPQTLDVPRPVQAPVAHSAAPRISITVVNAEPAGVGLPFVIDGAPYQSAGGSRQNLVVPTNSTITYDGGGSLGQRRYQIAAGVYEFRSTPDGWALYKLPQ